jgi:hypothetical protein
LLAIRKSSAGRAGRMKKSGGATDLLAGDRAASGDGRPGSPIPCGA